MTTPRPDTGTTEQPSTDQQKAAETAVAGTEPPDGTPDTPEPETFPRAVVEELRRENAEARTKAKRADDLARRLLTATIASTTAGILTDPTDLPVTDDLLGEDGYPDPARIEAAARDLAGRKPYLADRRPRGDVGQGATADAATVDLAGILRAAAS